MRLKLPALVGEELRCLAGEPLSLPLHRLAPASPSPAAYARSVRRPLPAWRAGMAIPSLRLPRLVSLLMTLVLRPLACQRSAATAAAVRSAAPASQGSLPVA